MASELRFRRGNSVQTKAFVGAEGEVTVDTTRKGLVVHDGVTPGGIPVANLADMDVRQLRFETSAAPGVRRSLHQKLQELRISFEDFGALGDGTANDTAALKLAIDWSQKTGNVAHGLPGKNYLITAGLHLVAPDTGKVARLHGGGSNCCRITPVGRFAAISSHGLGWGGSGQGAAFGVEFIGFEIDGRQLQGTLIDIRRVGLRSTFADIRGGGNDGIGMYLQSVFDHVYRDIEIRNCSDLGVHVFETSNAHPDGFQECSFLRFDSVHVIQCNRQGVQWRCSGGDGYTFISCKPSEGNIGIEFVNRSVGHSLLGTYVDGQTMKAAANIGIKVGKDCFNLAVVGGRFWNIKYAVDFEAGGRSSVTGTNVVFDSPATGQVFDARLQSSVQQPVTVAAGLSVDDQSQLMLCRPQVTMSGRWQPTLDADAGATGHFGYTEQAGEYRVEGGILYVKFFISWKGRPTGGTGFGIRLPLPVHTGSNHFVIRTQLVQGDTNGHRTLGHFQNNQLTTKLYLYPDGLSIEAASATAFGNNGVLIGQGSFFLQV